MNIPVYQRILAILIYILPWSDSIPFGWHLFEIFPPLKLLIIPAAPILILKQTIPFGSLILFFGLFIGVIRNQNVPYYLRFNTLQALLLDIIIVLFSYTVRILIAPIGSSLILRAFSSTLLISMLTIMIFMVIESVQGKEPDLPAISQAVRMQL